MATLAGRFCRSRAALAAAAATPARATSSVSTDEPAISSDSMPSSPSALRLDLKRSKAYRRSSVPSTSAPATPAPSGAAQESETAPELLRPGGHGRGGHPGPLGPELVALAQARDQHPPLAASGSGLVGQRHLLQAGLGLAQVHQPAHAGLGR